MITKVLLSIWLEKALGGSEAWISSDVFVAPGICISKGSVIGARSTILNDTDEGYVYFGHPAQRLKKELISRRMWQPYIF